MSGSGMVKEGADKSDSINARCSSALLRASCSPKVIVKESAASSCRLTSLLMVSTWVKTGDSLIARMYRPLILLGCQVEFVQVVQHWDRVWWKEDQGKICQMQSWKLILLVFLLDQTT